MKAILMAAGVGSRIGNHINQPKSTLPAGNSTIIGHTVDMLMKNGIDAHVVTGFMYECIHDALKGRKVTFHHNPFYKVTNSIASLWFARDVLFDDECILMMDADVYWGQDLLDLLLASEHDIAFLADPLTAAKGDLCFRTENGRIMEASKTIPPEHRNYESAGVAKVRNSVLPAFRKYLEEMILAEDYGSWWQQVIYKHLDVLPAYVVDIRKRFWAEVDCIEDHHKLQNSLLGKE